MKTTKTTDTREVDVRQWSGRVGRNGGEWSNMLGSE
jgi:hypothetical protein